MDLEEFLVGLYEAMGKTSMKRREEVTAYVRETLDVIAGTEPLNAVDPRGHIAVNEIDFPNGVSVGVDAAGNATDINLPAGWMVEAA